MWLTVPGESHSAAYRNGLELLEAIDGKYAVNINTVAPPEGYTTSYLRANRATYGDLNYKQYGDTHTVRKIGLRANWLSARRNRVLHTVILMIL